MKILTIILSAILLQGMCSCKQNPVSGNSDSNENPSEETVKYSIQEEELKINKGDLEIYGKLYSPKGVDKAPVVIVSHGYGGNHRIGKQYADAFVPMGYAVYSYDFCGSSNNCLSDGKTSDMTLFTECDDLVAVMNGLKTLKNIDKSRIILLGESQGGMVSALVAGEHKKEIERLLLVFPAFCIKDDWIKTYPEGSSIPETFDFWGVTLGKAFVETLYDLDVYESITKYEGPVQIFHGDNDQIVPLSYAEKAKQEYKNANLMVLSGEGHGFSPAAQNTVIETMKSILK